MEKTKIKIIQAATDLFIKNGFSGTSISDIAKEAGINQSLIYHHVGNKQDLWQAVKKFLIPDNDNEVNLENVSCRNLNDFINTIIKSRIDFYSRDHRIIRLVKWQILEEDFENNQFQNKIFPHYWIQVIDDLQEKGEITKQYSAEFFGFFIFSLVNSLIFDSYNIINKDLVKNNHYILLVKEIILNNLKAKVN